MTKTQSDIRTRDSALPTYITAADNDSQSNRNYLKEPNNSLSSPAKPISHFLLGAESALKHAKEREADLTATFSRFQISQSSYSFHAGFNESLIKLGVGYIQEIHIFVSVDVAADSPLVTELGKLLSPYPGVLFAPSSFHQTPVFTEDGSVWDFDELLLSQTTKYSTLHSSGTMSSDFIVAHTCNVLNDGVGASSGSSADRGISGSDSNQNEGNDDRRGNEKGREDKNAQNHRDSSGDGYPGDGDSEDASAKGKANISFPDVSFDVLANIYCPGDDSSTLFQELQINGTLTARVSSVFRSLQEKLHIASRRIRLR